MDKKGRVRIASTNITENIVKILLRWFLKEHFDLGNEYLESNSILLGEGLFKPMSTNNHPNQPRTRLHLG